MMNIKRKSDSSIGNSNIINSSSNGGSGSGSNSNGGSVNHSRKSSNTSSSSASGNNNNNNNNSHDNDDSGYRRRAKTSFGTHEGTVTSPPSSSTKPGSNTGGRTLSFSISDSSLQNAVNNHHGSGLPSLASHSSGSLGDLVPSIDLNNNTSGSNGPTSPNSSPPSARRVFKPPPKSNSVQFSVIYDKTSSGIDKIDEEDLFSRVNLQRIILGRNKLTEVPDRFSELPKVNTLDLSYNKLSKLPLSLSQSTELVNLLLAGNQFLVAAKDDVNNNSTVAPTITTNYTNNNDLSNSGNVIVNHSDVDELLLTGNNNNTDEKQKDNDVEQGEEESDKNNRETEITTPPTSEASLVGLPAEYGYITSLKKLDLTSNIAPGDWKGETYLPANLFWYSQIQTLLIPHCQLRSVSPDIQHMVSLTHLDIGYNCLKEVPSEIGFLKQIVHLSIKQNNLQSLPAELGCLESLTYLDASHNQLVKVTDDLRYCTLLETLNLSHNKLTKIPDCWFEAKEEEEEGGSYTLYSLKDFRIRENQIKALPSQFFNNGCPFSHLDLSQNELTELPEVAVGQNCTLENLSTLLLFNNKLKVVSSELLRQSSMLNYLNVSDNLLESISDTIWTDCQSLSQLYIGYNLKLKTIPVPADSYYALEELYLSGCESLTLESPLLTHIDDGSDLEYFPSLRELHLCGCNLTHIPAFIYKSHSLDKLEISSNKITSEGVNWDSLRKLENLIVLSLSKNQINNIPSFEDLMKGLSNLNIFDISFNQLTSIPTQYQEKYNDQREKEKENSVTQIQQQQKPPGSPGGAGSRKQTSILHVIYHHNKLPEENNQFQLWSPSKRFDIDMSEMMGRRPSMEDAFTIRGTFCNDQHMDLVALFDGHAGVRAASYSCQYFPSIVSVLIERYPSLPPLQWLKQAYTEISLQFKKYLVDRPEFKYCGATAAAALITDKHYYVSNIGDTRIVLCRNGKAIRLSYDHKPNDPNEEARIRRAGGFVLSNGDTARVNGTLAVSRSIGDFYMEPFVIPDPHLSITEVNKEQDQYLICACDGVWDEIDEQDACNIVCQSETLELATQKLRDYAYFRGSDDNITCIIFKLKK